MGYVFTWAETWAAGANPDAESNGQEKRIFGLCCA